MWATRLVTSRSSFCKNSVTRSLSVHPPLFFPFSSREYRLSALFIFAPSNLFHSVELDAISGDTANLPATAAATTTTSNRPVAGRCARSTAKYRSAKMTGNVFATRARALISGFPVPFAHSFVHLAHDTKHRERSIAGYSPQ